MKRVRRSDDRGHFDMGWLDTRHTFSFSDYYDPKFMGFSALRVINEDKVKPGRGFPTHPHQSMEIFTYVLEGALEHKDSMGNGSIIRPGDVQRMSAGSGVTHSEANPSKTDPVHLLQIWILPAKQGGAPSYEQKHFTAEEKKGRLRLVMSPDGREGSVRIQQDAELRAAVLGPGDKVRHEIPKGRSAWVQVARGEATLDGERLVAGDGVAIADEAGFELAGVAADSELLVFDLPGASS